jgi:molybdopterin/thiamine biosynthesis adenylyltransferase
MDSNKTEQLLILMRERALLVEQDPKLAAEGIRSKKLDSVKHQQKIKLENLKKLYFNAGRWAGGARDRVAREAFEKVGINELRA